MVRGGIAVAAVAVVAGCGPMSGPSSIDDAGLPEWTHHCIWGGDSYGYGACRAPTFEVDCQLSSYTTTGGVPGDECVQQDSHDIAGNLMIVFCCPPVSGLPGSG